jgi:hypothetical protein
VRVHTVVSRGLEYPNDVLLIPAPDESEALCCWPGAPPPHSQPQHKHKPMSSSDEQKHGVSAGLSEAVGASPRPHTPYALVVDQFHHRIVCVRAEDGGALCVVAGGNPPIAVPARAAASAAGSGWMEDRLINHAHNPLLAVFEYPRAVAAYVHPPSASASAAAALELKEEVEEAAGAALHSSVVESVTAVEGVSGAASVTPLPTAAAAAAASSTSGAAPPSAASTSASASAVAAKAAAALRPAPSAELRAALTVLGGYGNVEALYPSPVATTTSASASASTGGATHRMRRLTLYVSELHRIRRVAPNGLCRRRLPLPPALSCSDSWLCACDGMWWDVMGCDGM